MNRDPARHDSAAAHPGHGDGDGPTGDRATEGRAAYDAAADPLEARLRAAYDATAGLPHRRVALTAPPVHRDLGADRSGLRSHDAGGTRRPGRRPAGGGWAAPLGAVAATAAVVAGALAFGPLGDGPPGDSAGRAASPTAQEQAPGDGEARDAMAAQEKTADGRLVWTTTALVVDDGRPTLCLAGAGESNPPQCAGPTLTDWSWTGLEPRRAGDVRWGGPYRVSGTYEPAPARGPDADRFGTFTPTTAATPATNAAGGLTSGLGDRTSPCPTPPGGWSAPDPSRARPADRAAVLAAAERLPGFGAAWVDRRGSRPGDVVNVTVTGPAAPAQTALRRVWGGPLCVARAAHSRADLLAVIAEVSRRPGVMGGGPVGSSAYLRVVLDEDGRLQRELDARLGVGQIHVVPALRPRLLGLP